MSSERYVSFWRGRYKRPLRNLRRWYRCRCGRWWGKNKSTLCDCGKAPPSIPRKDARAMEAWFRRLPA